MIDNDFAIWKPFSNQFWPANYFIDAQGRIERIWPAVKPDSHPAEVLAALRQPSPNP